MTTFYICRHGETENNRAKRHQGWIDTPLTPKGVMNAKAVAIKLQGKHIDKIISSDLGRAFISAYIISRHIGYDDEIELNANLREINYGELANTHYDQFPDIEPGTKSDFVFPEGESLRQLQTRVLEEIGRINDKYKGQTVLIVGHDGTINSIRAGFTKEDIADADLVSSSHDFLARFTYGNGMVQTFIEVQ
jgi:broad specificity phosphatase PhoE